MDSEIGLNSGRATMNFLSDQEVRRIQNEFRIPVDSFNPSKFWIIALYRESFLPTEQELKQLRSYCEYVIQKHYTSRTREMLMNLCLPVCTGHNTAIFNNGLRRGVETQRPGHWFFRKISWRDGCYFPNYLNTSYHPHTLI